MDSKSKRPVAYAYARASAASERWATKLDAKSRPPVAYGYARVSTAAQVADGNSLPTQSAAIDGYFASSVPAGTRWGGTFIDNERRKGKKDGVSGKTRMASRKAGGELLARLLPGDHVIVNDLTRMFRSFRDAVATVEDWVERGITLHEVRNRLDTSTVQGRTFFRFMAVFAQMEREMISERTREVLANRKRDGKAVGGRAKPGFRYAGAAGSRRQVEDQHEQGAVDQIVRLVDVEGKDFDEVTRVLHLANIRTREGEKWSRSRIYRAYKIRKGGSSGTSKGPPTAAPSE